jgi:hypothetical protein
LFVAVFGYLGYEKLTDMYRWKWAKFLNKRKNLSLSCQRCGKLAAPVLGTINRYRCRCGNQFAGDSHKLKLPNGIPAWYNRKPDDCPYMDRSSKWYDPEMDPCADKYDPQKDFEETRYWQELKVRNFEPI